MLENNNRCRKISFAYRTYTQTIIYSNSNPCQENQKLFKSDFTTIFVCSVKQKYKSSYNISSGNINQFPLTLAAMFSIISQIMKDLL
jgi:hypothetical protein